MANVEVVEQLSGFRYLDGRQLTGFIDAPQNPRGLKRRQAALVTADESTVFAAGSYVYLQRLAFDAVAWQQLAVSEQEEIMGYDKVSGKRLAGAMLLPDSHIALMQPEPDRSASRFFVLSRADTAVIWTARPVRAVIRSAWVCTILTTPMPTVPRPARPRRKGAGMDRLLKLSATPPC